MRITITQDFDTPEAAAAFLARIGSPAHAVHQINLSPTRIVRTVAEDIGDGVAERTAAVVAGTKARKPRSDAGKARGPQNKDAAPAAPAAQAQEAQRAEPVPPPAPATPTATAPAPTGAGEKASTPTSAPTAAAPTHDDARAELQKLHNTKGKGMDACIATIRAFGFNRVVDLPKEKLADFIKDVREQVAAQTRANALAKAAK